MSGTLLAQVLRRYWLLRIAKRRRWHFVQPQGARKTLETVCLWRVEINDALRVDERSSQQGGHSQATKNERTCINGVQSLRRLWTHQEGAQKQEDQDHWRKRFRCAGHRRSLINTWHAVQLENRVRELNIKRSKLVLPRGHRQTAASDRLLLRALKQLARDGKILCANH